MTKERVADIIATCENDIAQLQDILQLAQAAQNELYPHDELTFELANSVEWEFDRMEQESESQGNEELAKACRVLYAVNDKNIDKLKGDMS